MKKLVVVCALLSGCVATVKEVRVPVGVPVQVLDERDLKASLFICKPEPRTQGLLCTDFERYLLQEQEQEAKKNPSKQL